MKKILVVDDHAVVRKGLQQILAEYPDKITVVEASTGEEAVAEALKDQFDLVLLDIALPGKSGIDVLQELKSKQPGLPVVILSIHSEEQYAVRALKAGAAGYLIKDCVPEELILAIRKVLQGDRYVCSSLAERIVLGLDRDTLNPPHIALSNREYQVMLMIAQGKTGKQIANELSVSIKTVSTYRSRILEKMKIESNAEITRYAIKHGLIPNL